MALEHAETSEVGILDLRYPIGTLSEAVRNVGPRLSPEDRTCYIQTLRDLPQNLKAAVSGLNEAQLDTPYREDGWTVRQVVHHVADSHSNANIRMRLALTEDWPPAKPYQEAAWTDLADARTLPVEVSLDLLNALHVRWVVLLESLTEADFDRGYVHPQNGRQTLTVALATYAWHGRHHTAHILNLRRRMNW